MKRLLYLLLVGALLLSLLASCKSNGSESEGSGSGDVGKPDSPVGEAGITVADLERYSIVYSEDATADLVEGAKKLASAIRSRFGCMLSVKDDYYNDFSPTYQKSEYEILVGRTNREESGQITDGLLFHDSRYTLVGKKIVITAHDDVSVLKALSDFNLKFVLSAKADTEIFFSQSNDRVLSGFYPHSSVSLGGIEIGQYRIVYPESDQAFESMLVQKLWLAIADDCGAMLPVVSDSTPYNGEYEILIGKTNRSADVSAVSSLKEGEGFLNTDGKLTVLCGQNSLGNATAVTGLIDAIEGSDGKTAALELKAQVQPLLDRDGRVSSMTFNLQSWNRTEERMVRLRDTILRYLPDTVGLQEGTLEWNQWLIEQLGDYYGFLGTEDSMNMCPILYAKEKFSVEKTETLWLTETPYEESELPGQEWPRIYTYAILVRSTDGTRFLHLNTHLDTADVRVAEAGILATFLFDYSDMPVIMTGDFNAAINSEELQILTQEDLVDSMAIADQIVTDSSALIDFILVHDYFIDVKYYERAYEKIYGDYASDHRAVYAEYIIDLNGTEVKDPTGPEEGVLPVNPDREGSSFGPPHFVF